MDQTEKHCLLRPSQRSGCALGASLGSGHIVAGRPLLVTEWAGEQTHITQGGDCKCGEAQAAE